MGEQKRSIEEINKDKSEAQKRRWEKRKLEKESGVSFSDTKEDRSGKKYNFKCFEGLSLVNKQKEFIVRFMDPPHSGRRENRFKAYEEVYTASSPNSLKANCTALMNKSKVKEGILAYQRYALQNLKIEATNQNVDALRLRATYSVSDFYKEDGTPKPLNEISPEKLICIDDIDIDWKLSNKSEKRIVKYKLANREKAMDTLQKMLGIMKEMESINVSIPVGEESNAIDNNSANNTGPRISLNMTVGNPFNK